MVELAEWSAQVLRCQGSDVPVKVVYIRGREYFYGLPEESPELGKQTFSHHASGGANLGSFLSGRFFDAVEVLDSKKESSIESAFEAFLSKFKNSSRVVPFDPKANDGLKLPYAKPIIEPSKEDDDLLSNLLDPANKERKKEEEERRKNPSTRRKKLDDMTSPSVRLSKLYALISGIITELNPSGMWIVEEFFNDEEEVM